ncbi:MAG: glycosyltransferase family 39 protein [bacterium]
MFPRGSRINRLGAAPWMLILALIAVVVGYLPTLDAPLFSDDYIYLNASRRLSFAHYARLSFTPWSHEPLLPFTRDFWRPLSFLYFEAMRPLFGGHVLPYHLVNLAVHLAGVVLVWVLARRLDARPVVAGVAVLVFALYPGSTEAISWISSINSAGLPFALACWLLFLVATKESQTRWILLAGSTACLAIALMFRETAATVVVPVGLWYLLVQRRGALREFATYKPLLPMAALLLGYYLIRTRLFSEPAANPDIYGFDSKFDNHWWYYIRNTLLPFRDPVTGWRVGAQDVSGVVFLALLMLTLATRKWGAFALLLSIPIAVVPSSAALLGVGQRYFYFTTPLLALALGLLLADARDALGRRVSARLLASTPSLVAAVLFAGFGTYIAFDRNDHWEEIGPDREQAWVDELRAEYPTLPAGGTLYCIHVPLVLVVFEAANLLPTVQWLYPDIGAAVWVPDDKLPPLPGPNDRIFIADDGLLLGRDTTAQK